MPSIEEEVGEKLHEELMEHFGHETEAWALERMARVSERLNQVRLRCPESGACLWALTTEILWLGQMTAFAVPGRYVYLSRGLLQRLEGDDPVALVIAHELAHHDLGHVRLLVPALSKLGRVPGSVLGGILQRAQSLVYGKERESAADAYGLHLCLAAGYDPYRCLTLLDILENESLDWRDLSGVFGGEGGLAGRFASHPPLQERRRALKGVLAEYGL